MSTSILGTWNVWWEYFQNHTLDMYGHDAKGKKCFERTFGRIKWWFDALPCIGLYGCFRKQWSPQIIHFNRVFHYKPSILGYPYSNYFWKHPNKLCINLPFGDCAVLMYFDHVRHAIYVSRNAIYLGVLSVQHHLLNKFKVILGKSQLY